MKFLLLLTLLSCATSLKSVKTSDIKEDEGLFFSKIKVVIDGEDATSSCYINFINEKEKKFYISMDDSNLMIGKLPKGKVYLDFFACRTGIHHHIAEIREKNISFQNCRDGRVSYLGNLKVLWNSKDYSAWAFLIGPGRKKSKRLTIFK